MKFVLARMAFAYTVNLPEMPFDSAQNGKLTSLLDHVRATVPFYENAGSALAAFPIVSKKLILANIECFISKDAPCDRAQLAAVLAEGRTSRDSEIEFNGKIVIDQTSGSSGVPFRIPKTKAERIAASIAIWRYRKSFDDLLSTRTFYALIHRPMHQIRPENAQQLLRLLAEKKIRWLHANPAILRRYSNIMAERPDSRLAEVRYVESSGQFLDKDTRSLIEGTLGVTLLDQYGCREVWAIGYAANDVFIPLTDNVLVEIVDQDGAAITSPGKAGRLLVTGLHQRLFPFIRYDTGDFAQVAPDGRGGYGIKLSPHRPHHLIVGTCSVYGTEVFKSIMMGVYKAIGYVTLTYLQIRQISCSSFLLVVNRNPHADAIRDAVERMFNSRKILNFPAGFILNQIDNESDIPANEKESIFTNSHYAK